MKNIPEVWLLLKRDLTLKICKPISQFFKTYTFVVSSKNRQFFFKQKKYICFFKKIDLKICHPLSDLKKQPNTFVVASKSRYENIPSSNIRLGKS